MKQPSSIAFVAACALALGGCISLFPMPGGGKKKQGPPEKPVVDGKVFGTGTMTVEEWGVVLLLDPATVDTANAADHLVINSGKGGGYDPINGDFEFSIRKKQPGETPRTRLADELKKLNVHRKPENYKGQLASFDAAAIMDQTSNGDVIGTITVAEQGSCIIELIVVAPDIDQLVRLEQATRAGILAKVGKTPNPAACQ
ncbi:MAG TPA: hypothetical protein VM261_22340 [Kofleriaceae bacterium]|nr:hypothetical protein [Kofleriaceae bacterium]